MRMGSQKSHAPLIQDALAQCENVMEFLENSRFLPIAINVKNPLAIKIATVRYAFHILLTMLSVRETGARQI